MQLLIKTLPGGKTITLEVNGADTVQIIKTKIQKQEGIPPNQQTVIFGNKKLKDHTILCNIPDKSTLLLVVHDLKGDMQLFVTTPTGKTVALDVDNSNTIETLKTMIWEKQSFPPDQQWLVFDHRPLEDGKTLADYNIPNRSILHLLLRFGGVMKISVRTLSGKSFSLEVKSTDKIETVKTRIQYKEGIPTRHQRLVFGTSELEDGKTLADYNVQKKSTVFLVLCSGRTMPICVQTPTGEALTFEVTRFDTIENVKNKIKDQLAIPPQAQRLFFNGKELQDGMTLADYSVWTINKEATD